MKFNNSPRPLAPRPTTNIKQDPSIFSKNQSGNSMKGIFGQDHLVWGEAVQQQQQQTASARPMQTGFDTVDSNEVEYPLPGSMATCDCCGDVTTRFYHCTECCEEAGGLFDLCVVCCGAAYLNTGSPSVFEQVRTMRHPTHNFQRHQMVHVAPPK